MKTILALSTALLVVSTAAFAQSPAPVNPATAASSSGQVVYGTKLEACLSRGTNASYGCYVYDAGGGKMKGWCPKDTPASRDVAKGCHEEAVAKTNAELQPKKWAPAK